MSTEKTLLRISNLSVTFALPDKTTAYAVQDVSFRIAPGERVALVGESGSGKSVTAHSIMRIEYPGVIAKGSSITLRDQEMTLPTLREKDLRPFRGGVAAMVFQDPTTAFQPVVKVGAQIVEAILAHRPMQKTTARREALALLRSVSIEDAEDAFEKYPFQFSGGQLQRALIAMALAGEPDLLIADEATTALDVSVQAEILDLINKIVRERDMALLFISHNLGVVAGLCDRVLVMYAGHIVEEGSVRDIFASPRHPYTQALLQAVSRIDKPKHRNFSTIPGHPPRVDEVIVGCPFRLRACPYAEAICETELPVLAPIGGAGQLAACHLVEKTGKHNTEETHVC